ncbi:MAG TPA: SGNH/GDSL hydrolase family protein [Polyangiales bacterium]|nr:SGNH/GDSL hydrolase family protein [Polyangiales bacterium]
MSPEADGGARGYAPCPPRDVCKILPFGDSITSGHGYEGGYRIELFRRAVAAGKWITFLGSQRNGPAIVADTSFPQDHEGHPGFRIDQLRMPDLEPPHIVLLMAGTNDIGQAYDLPHAPERLGELLDHLTAAAPDALVVVARLPPLETYRREVAAYNAALSELIDVRVEAGKHIQLVDMFADFPDTELADGVHPTAAGYERMANIWFEAIRASLR